MKNKRNYWGEEQEQLVKEFINEVDVIKRSIVYSKLHPSVYKMVKGVLHRYFHNFLINFDNDQDVINDCIGYLILYPFKTFDQSKGKAYAFIGTSAKHYFYDRFITANKKQYDILPVDDEEGNIIYDVIDQPSTNDMEEYLQLKSDARQLIITKLNVKGSKRLLKPVLQLLDLYNWSKHYATFFLLRKTGLSGTTLFVALEKVQLQMLVFTKYPIEHYEKLINDNNLITEEQIKEYLNKYGFEKKDNGQNYKIENRAEERTKKLQAKRIRKSVGQSV